MTVQELGAIHADFMQFKTRIFFGLFSIQFILLYTFLAVLNADDWQLAYPASDSFRRLNDLK